MSVRGRVFFVCWLSFSTIGLSAEPKQSPALLKQAVPDTSLNQSALDHLRLAAEQLKAAGLNAEAEKLQEVSGQIRQRIRQKQAELEKQVKQLRRLAGTPDQILCRCAFLELTRDAAAEFAETAKPVSSTNTGVSVYQNAEAAIQQLKQAGKVKVVHASPHIVTAPGQPATFESGGEFPIVIPAGDNQTSVEWKPFGVICKVEPDLLENGKVLLRFSPEISERDFANAVQVNDLTVPGLTVRRISTKAELNLGETLVVKTVSKSKDQEETVTLFMVTPVAMD
ncbi:MAG: hypothetical protein KDA77_05580 [Planctomycetaceae bacterium]|nr:hypothetical protein [Planctomycetaceae bacterium]